VLPLLVSGYLRPVMPSLRQKLQGDFFVRLERDPRRNKPELRRSALIERGTRVRQPRLCADEGAAFADLIAWPLC
jgi:hypothetical protein